MRGWSGREIDTGDAMLVLFAGQRTPSVSPSPTAAALAASAV
jgi:hypothetical protein